MADIVLTTLNAKFIHAAFGLRYLLANMGPWQGRTELLEFDIHQRPADVVEKLLERDPQIVGIGVYIWNAAQSRELVTLLKRVRPDIRVVLGGPEVSYEVESQSVVGEADYVITGEGDLKFPELCEQILTGTPPQSKVLVDGTPDVRRLSLPYAFYDDRDVAHRVVYVEASRGCPFTCEFCLSSISNGVRQFDLNGLLEALDSLLERGVQHFKFVDRTFNLNVRVGQTILEFFYRRYRPGLFLHFEMVPDRLPEGLRDWIAKFPPGALQFEIGIQTFNEEVAARIRRRQDLAKLEENFRFLRRETGVHIHADLIVGLPGESLESFACGFDRLVALRPQEIQVGILKRLRGTPIVRHDDDWGMVYNPDPPYELLRNRTLDFQTMQRMRRFARFWDLVANSGNFVETTPLLWEPEASPFRRFMQLSDRLYSQFGRSHSISLGALAEKVFEFLTDHLGHSAEPVAATLWRDYQRGGRSDKPPFLRPYLAADPSDSRPAPKATTGKRQSRHRAAASV